MWYAIGTIETPQVLGHYKGDPADMAEARVGWVNLEPWYDHAGLVASDSTRYWTSMYYVLNALDGNGNTDMER